MNGLRFHDPLWLLLLPVLFGLLFLEARAARRHAFVFPSLAHLAGAPRSLRQRCAALLPALRFAGAALLLVALARPQQGHEEFRVRSEGIAIVLAIDRSGSMAALDFERDGAPADRLTVVKDVVADFVRGADGIAGRPDDRIGLVVFGGFAEGRCPLTLDHDSLLSILADVEIPGMDPDAYRLDQQFTQEEGATAIGDALALAVKRLEGAAGRSKVVILLSDGKNTAGVLSPQQGAELAAARGVKVHAVGIGSTGFAPFRVALAGGGSSIQRAPVELDETTLRAVAEATGGRFFNARSADALSEVYREIDRLEKTEVEGTTFRRYAERFAWLLAPALALLALDLLWRATRGATVP